MLNASQLDQRYAVAQAATRPGFGPMAVPGGEHPGIGRAGAARGSAGAVPGLSFDLSGAAQPLDASGLSGPVAAVWRQDRGAGPVLPLGWSVTAAAQHNAWLPAVSPARRSGLAGDVPRWGAAAPCKAVERGTDGLPGRVEGTFRFACPGEIALPALALERPAAAPGAQHFGRSIGIPRGFSRLDAVLKRSFDLVFAALLLVAAFPLLVAVAAALQVDSPGPVLFIQQRIGRRGRSFGCIKLRTMRVDAEEQLAALLASCPRARREWAADHKLRRDPRVSRTGQLVRKLSLDELPQLVNVLLGQMSMIGPRPIVAAEIDRYGGFFADYCAVKPGITGLWQVSGRNDVTYGERVQLDRHYVRHASFRRDLQIALRTVPAVLFASGSY